MSDATITLLTLAAVVVLFVTNRVPVEIPAVGSALLLWGLGILTLNESLAGFADPAVLFIAGLFIVSEALDATGVTTWLGQLVVERAGESGGRLLMLIMMLAALMTALIGLNGTVASLLPMAIVVAMRRALLPSRLLMPMVYAGAAGQLLLLTGSPVNVVISDAAEQASGSPFQFGEFLWVGIPLVIGTIVICLFLSERLVPERTSTDLPPDLSDYASTIVNHYKLSDVAHLVVTNECTLLGQPRPTHIPAYPELRLLAVTDSDLNPIEEGLLAEGDRLTIVGPPSRTDQYAFDTGLVIEEIRSGYDMKAELLNRRHGAVEILIPPRSEYVGMDVTTGKDLGGVMVLAITRQDADLGSGPVPLTVGDTLLVEGSWTVLDEAARRRDVLVVDSPDMVRRQAVPLSYRSSRAIAVVVAMILLLALGIFPAAVTALLAAAAMILLRVVTMEQAYRGINWTTLVLIAGMFPMSTAISKSGAGEMIATQMVESVGALGPTALLAGMFVITVVFGQLISNTATALVMIPIGISAAEQLGVSSRPVLMSLCVAATVSFLTPVATPPNMMVMGPGGYRFGDYWKLGAPLVVLFGVVAILGVPLVWRF